jgi:hypothetical protein
MTDLYVPGRHEPLAGVAWDAGVARDAIGRIVADTRAAASAAGTWPVHPEDGPEGSLPNMGLYFGAAGIIWALEDLTRSGFAPPGDTFAEHLPRILAWNAQGHAQLGLPTQSYLMAQAGILLALYRATPSAATADALAAAVAENAENPALELMWGAPGTMLAALALHRLTGEARWADMFRVSADVLEQRFVLDPDLQARIWTQDLYGNQLKYLGVVHGFAGAAFALIAGRDLLPEAAWAKWSAALAQTLEATAVRGQGGVNWFAGVSPPRPGKIMPVQICHGAPGMVVGLAALPEPIDDLLAAAGELIWAAGPLAKGFSLCHGTAGNGYAFLKLHARSGDPRWLDRARAFAMHAIGQSERAAVQGRRHSLWTGDLGLALYLADCIEGRARFPTLDVD